MKTLLFSILSIFSLSNCGNQTQSNQSETEKNSSTVSIQTVNIQDETSQSDTIFSFDDAINGEIPSGWSQYFTGKGKKTEWKIVDDSGNKVLTQLSENNPNYHFNEIVFDGFKLKNVELTVKIKGVAGKMDQGGGFIWRYMSEGNYYVVRANPLEDNVVLYKVEDGKRTDLPLINKGKTYGVDVESLGKDWNILKLIVKDNIFTVFLNDKELFRVDDKTFPEAGKVGLWTKADAVTYFDDLQIKTLE